MKYLEMRFWIWKYVMDVGGLDSCCVCVIDTWLYPFVERKVLYYSPVICWDLVLNFLNLFVCLFWFVFFLSLSVDKNLAFSLGLSAGLCVKFIGSTLITELLKSSVFLTGFCLMSQFLIKYVKAPHWHCVMPISLFNS